MKKRNMGFMLAETLIVSTFITSTLIFLFIQFRNIHQSYETTFAYNNVDDLYRTSEARKYLLQNLIVDQVNLEFDVRPYVNMTTCPTQMVNELIYCAELWKLLNIKTILLTEVPLTSLIDHLYTQRDVSETFLNFIKYTNAGTESYRLFIEFNDGKYASLPVVF